MTEQVGEKMNKTEIREMNYKSHPRMDMYVLHREEQYLLELRHEEELLKREEMAHLHTLKIVQKDLKQIRIRIQEKEAGYKSHFHSPHHDRYNSLSVEVMRRETLAERRSPMHEMRDIQLIHYPDQIQQNENRRLTPSPPIIPSPSESKSPKLRGSSSLPSFMLPTQKTMFPIMQRSLKGPPMKICISCKHSIHRNAPVCPICKSKSYSKNPKKRKSSE